ncbi:MAG: rod shape-determining protein RodA [Oleibacter sp.]|nr:rod shape-determining protein RodA [Thalassolituus sp.]
MANVDFQRTVSTPSHHYSFERSGKFFARFHVDLTLLMLLTLLAVTGLLILFSGSGQEIGMVKRQAIHFGIGLLLMIGAAQITPRQYQFLAPWGYIVGVILLAGVLFFGVGAKGAQRWLELPGLPRFQPSELVKLTLPLTVAWFMSKHSVPPRFSNLLKALIIIFIPTLLILKQPDLGTSILISASGILVLFFAGVSWTLITSMITLLAACAPAMWFFVMHDYQKQRVLTFLNPESDPLGSGWNIIQSKTAIGSGGVHGKGYLMGSQSHLEFLPESHTDFIIAVLAEETGLLGVCMLLILYTLIIMRCLYMAANCSTLFGRLLSGSIAITFFIYVFVNIGMVSGILPIVGVPLPMISYGGTSVVSLFLAFGILMSMYTHREN